MLTNLLLDKLISTSPSRVINTIGVGYDKTNIDFADFNMERCDGRRGEAYNRSKLAMALFTTELARRLEGFLFIFDAHRHTHTHTHTHTVFAMFICLSIFHFPVVCSGPWLPP